MSSRIDKILDARPLNGWQYWIIAVIFAALIIDGLDVQLLSLVAPLILKDWSIGRDAFGPAMSAALLGSSIGSSIGGWLGDRFGRKTVLSVATLIFGVGTILAAFTHNVHDMTLLRLAGGLGFGAALPASVALVGEWLPHRLRARIVGMTSAGTPIGGMIGSVFLIGLLPSYGWRGCFVLCGLVSLVFGCVAFLALPESPAGLVARGKAGRAAALLSRYLSVPCSAEDLAEGTGPGAGPASAAGLASADMAGQRARVFERRNLRLNMGAWLAFFGVYFVTYGSGAWLPLMLTGAGLSLPEALHASFMFNLCSVISAFLHGVLVTRFGSRRLLVNGGILTLVSVALMAYGLQQHRAGDAGTAMFAVLAASGGLGGFNGALIAVIYVVLAHGFPPVCRAGGIGMAMMVGRVGGILSTFLGGTLLSVPGAQERPFLFALAGATLLALLGTFIIDRHVRPVPRHQAAPV